MKHNYFIIFNFCFGILFPNLSYGQINDSEVFFYAFYKNSFTAIDIENLDLLKKYPQCNSHEIKISMDGLKLSETDFRKIKIPPKFIHNCERYLKINEVNDTLNCFGSVKLFIESEFIYFINDGRVPIKVKNDILSNLNSEEIISIKMKKIKSRICIFIIINNNNYHDLLMY